MSQATHILPTPVSALLHAANYTHSLSWKSYKDKNSLNHKKNCDNKQNFSLFNYSTSSNFIPWKFTSSSINAFNSINNFYKWLPKNSKINKFLLDYCSFLIESSPDFLLNKNSHTNIPSSFYSVSSILNNSELKDCLSLKSADKGFKNLSSCYIYAFIHKDSKNLYIGSTISPFSRLHNYIHSGSSNSSGRHSLLREMKLNGGWSQYKFFPGYSIPNYLKTFISLNPSYKLDIKSKFILNSFSELHIRLLEQSVISYYKPSINDFQRSVSFSFTSINIDTYKPANSFLKNHKISVYDKNGFIYNEHSSIKQASSALGLTEHQLRWNRNRTDHFVYCPIPNLKLLIIDDILSSSQIPLSYHSKLPQISGIDLDLIPEGFIYAYLEDKTTLLEVFNSASEFASIYNLNPWQAYRYLNKEKPIAVFEGTSISFIYLCTSPIYRKKLLDIQDKRNWPVVSIDTFQKDEIRYHDNPKSARKELSNLLGIFELKPTRNFTSAYITGLTRKGVKLVPSKFGNRFKLLWFKDFSE